MATINDVAKAAGVSAATVSYVLNGKEGVGEENRKKILEIMKKMDYTPRQEARNLSSKSSNLIGLLTTDISNPYNMEFLKHTEAAARRHGKQIMLICSQDDPEKEGTAIDTFIAQNVCGLIICPGAYSSGENFEIGLKKLHKKGIAVVFFYYLYENEMCIFPDLKNGEYRLVREIMQKGFRKAAFFGGPLGDYYTRLRYEGFENAISENAEYEGEYFDCGHAISFDCGTRSIEAYMRGNKLPEVIFCVNDELAYGVIKGLKRHGVRVPEDVSVVGFDGIKGLVLDDVRLTTAVIPVQKMCNRGVEMLLGGGSEREIFQVSTSCGNTVKGMQ